MSELLPITLLSIFLAILSHRRSEYDPISMTYQKKEKLFYIILVIYMTLFVGLRTDYNDTRTYTDAYNMMEIGDTFNELFDGIEWLKLGENPGFEITSRILKYFGASDQTYLMFYAILTICINLWFLRKYSRNFAWSLFLYVTFSGYTFALAAIKQCIAMAFCLIAVDRHIQKKNLGFVFWILLAAL